MKSKRAFFLIIQLLLVVLFSIGLYYLVHLTLKPVTVYEAKSDISINQEISIKNFKTTTYPKGAVTNDFITDPNYFNNKIADTRIYAGQKVIKQMLTDNTDIDSFANIDYKKYRKISLSVDYDSTFGGELKRGDYIDILPLIETKDVLGEKNIRIGERIENILIYSVTTDEGAIYTSKIDEKNLTETSKKVDSQYGDISTVTLIVTPEETDKIAKARKEGYVQIVGRFKNKPIISDIEKYESKEEPETKN